MQLALAKSRDQHRAGVSAKNHAGDRCGRRSRSRAGRRRRLAGRLVKVAADRRERSTGVAGYVRRNIQLCCTYRLVPLAHARSYIPSNIIVATSVSEWKEFEQETMKPGEIQG